MQRIGLGLLLFATCAAASCASPSRPGAATVTAASAHAPDPLPLWNDGTTKRAVFDFVMRATSEGPDHVSADDRVAAFDAGGTLGEERPFARVYTPMMELLRFLERRGFETYLVATADLDFMRSYAPEVYGIPESRVVESVEAIGKRPVFVAQSLRKNHDPASVRRDTAARFMLVVRHDDASRDLAYDERALVAPVRAAGAVIVSTKDDWGRIYSPN